MASLAPFVHQNKARINKFQMDLCEVGDFYETLEVMIVPLVVFGHMHTHTYSRLILDGPICCLIEERPRAVNNFK